MLATSPISRVGQAAYLAATSTGLALLAHIGAGGVLPEAITIVVPFVLAFALAALLGLIPGAFRGKSLGTITAVVALSHTLFHYLFMAGSYSVTASGVPVPGHEHHFMPALSASGGPEFASLVMFVSHAAGGALTVALMHRAEAVATHLRQVLTLLATWAGFTVALGGWVISPARGVALPSAVRVFAPLPIFLATLRRRGPPMSWSALAQFAN